jgi:metallo-beta-lactamase class B
MNRTAIFLLAAALLLAPAPGHTQSGQDDSHSPPTTGQEAFSYPPFRVFDNLYYIGIGWVAAWLIDTGDGLVLIDTLYDEHVEPMLDKIRSLGFDPADIRYVFVTHAHFDHCGGVARVKEVSGAVVGMTAEDWNMFAADADGSSGLPGFPTIPTDLVLDDGQQITLGDATFIFFKTPGHTPGVLSMSFPVRDGDALHKAFMFGGTGLNFSGADRTRQYLDSVDRILAMDGLEVNVPNHASMGAVFQRNQKLKLRKPGEPHPFVDPDGFRDFLTDQRAQAVRKLERENAAEPR